MKANDEAIFQLDIKTTRAGPTATWTRPQYFQTDGESFSRVSGPPIRRSAQSITLENGEVVLSFDDPAPNSTPDIFHLHCAGSNRLKVEYQGTGFEPFDFVREQPNKLRLGPWDAARRYVRAVIRPTNAEMTAIFDADQTDRDVKNIDWSIVGPADEKRRIRTQELLNSGTLQSGDDFYHAAFVFQHGSTADDYLKAHLFAIISVARGKSEAVWIASATLDRYLQTIGKPQVLGTQYNIPKNAPATQEPYDRTLVSDAMRKALKVPTIAEQEDQRKEYSGDASKH